ncbi:hypothetical protein PRIPAC_76342, partial [Pristionchus pacificus]|uniref:Peptidase n=1 Tax=Pristionchus pacificus TaxID=54126 RepID=A0A2A6BGH9_PRIPA
MWSPLFILFFLHFANATTEDIDPLTVTFPYLLIMANLIDFVNASINPCDNFYRRLCPKDFPAKSWIWLKSYSPKLTHSVQLKTQIAAMINIKNFLSPKQEDHTIQRINAAAAMDETNYTDERAIVRSIYRLSPNSLAALVVSAISHGHLRFLPNALKRNRTAAIASIATSIKHFMNGNYKLLSTMVFDKFEDVILVDRATRVNGIEYEAARMKIENIIKNVIEEYLLRIRSATWSSKEDRFGYTGGHILTTYVTDVSCAISFANQYSIPENDKEFVIELYHGLLIQQYELHVDLMFEFSHMPSLRVFLSKYAAYSEVTAKAHFPQMRLSHALEPYAATISEHIDLNRISVASIVINQVFSMHASLTAHTSTLIVFTGYVFAHEMYHQIQLAFTGKKNPTLLKKACASSFTVSEDAADVYGVQIAFAVAQKMLGNDIDMFYQTIGASVCTTDKLAQWLYKIVVNGVEQPDVHNGRMYRVNGLLGQLPDFKAIRTFGCYDDDRMVFLE